MKIPLGRYAFLFASRLDLSSGVARHFKWLWAARIGGINSNKLNYVEIIAGLEDRRPRTELPVRGALTVDHMTTSSWFVPLYKIFRVVSYTIVYLLGFYLAVILLGAIAGLFAVMFGF